MKVLIVFLLFIPIISLADSIKVMVIDTGINGNDYHLKPYIKEQFNQNYKDINGHGTHIAGLVTQDTCSRVELISCKFFEENQKADMNKYMNCLHKAIDLKVNFINFSAVGYKVNKIERNLLKKLTKAGTVVVVAAGNNSKDLKDKCEYFPACYKMKNLITVGALDHESKKLSISNYNIPNMVWELGENVPSLGLSGTTAFMTGSSQATAIRTNRLIKQKCLQN